MADRSNTIVEGPLKYRDGKKWRSRWCVVRKQSPVADRLHVILFKDIAERNNNKNLNKLPSTIPNEDFFTIEQGFPMDKEQFVLCIICQNHVLILAFPTKDANEFWSEKIKSYLGNDVEYPVLLVRVPVHSKLTVGPVRLHIQNQRIYLTMSFPPKLLWSWHLYDLKKFGVIEKKFCFEGGSRCGKGSGIHAFATEKAKEINSRIEEATLSRSHYQDSTSRSPHKLSINRRSTLSQRLENFKPAHPGVKDFDNKEVDGDLNFRSDTLRGRSGSQPVASSSQSALDSWDKRRAFSTYDVPPSLPRRVESFCGTGTRCIQSDTMLDMPKDAPPPELPPRGSVMARKTNDDDGVPKLPPRGKKTHYSKHSTTSSSSGSLNNLCNKIGYVNSICDVVNVPSSGVAPSYKTIVKSDSRDSRYASQQHNTYRNVDSSSIRNIPSTSPDSGCEENDAMIPPPPSCAAGLLLVGDPANLDPSPNKRGSQVLEFVNLSKYDGKDEDYMCDVSTIKKMVENEAKNDGSGGNVVVPVQDKDDDTMSVMKKHSYVNVPTKCITYGFHIDGKDVSGQKSTKETHDYKNIPPARLLKPKPVAHQYVNVPGEKPTAADLLSPYKNVPQPRTLAQAVKTVPNGLCRDYANVVPAQMKRLNSTAVSVQPCRGKTLDINVANSTSDYINMTGGTAVTAESGKQCQKTTPSADDYVNMTGQSNDYMNVAYHNSSIEPTRLQLPPSGKQRRSSSEFGQNALSAKVVKVPSQTGVTAESVPVVSKSEKITDNLFIDDYIDMSGVNVSQYNSASNSNRSSVIHSRNNSNVSDSSDCDFIMMKTLVYDDDSGDYIDMSGVKLSDGGSGERASSSSVESKKSETPSSKSCETLISVNPVDIDVSSNLVARHTTMSQCLDSAGIDDSSLKNLKLPVHGSYVQFLVSNQGGGGNGEIKRCNSVGTINAKSKMIKDTFTRSRSLRMHMNSNDSDDIIFSPLKPSVSMDGCIDAQNIETGYESWSKSQINSDSNDSVTQSDSDLKRFKRHGYAKMKSTRPKSMVWGEKRHPKLPTFFRRLMRRSSFDRRKHRNQDSMSTDSEDATSPMESSKKSLSARNGNEEKSDVRSAENLTAHKRSESLPKNAHKPRRGSSTESEVTGTPPGGIDDEMLVVSNESIQSSKSYQSAKKKPFRVKRSMSYHCPGTSSSAIIDYVDVSDGRSHSVSNPIPISSPSSSSFRISRSHGATITIPEDNEPVWMPRRVKAKDAAKFGHSGFDTNHRGESSRGVSDCVAAADYTDSLSLSSHGSSDTYVSRHDDILKTSPAATVLRPRSGKEYQKLDRKKLAEDLNCQQTAGTSEQTTPISPTTSASSVFTFDQEMNGSPTRNGYFSNHGNDSPRSPHEINKINKTRAVDQSRIYMNVRESPKSMYMNTLDTPPSTSPQYGVSPQALEQINPLLNYAELDLSPGRSKSASNGKSTLSSSPQLNYADIDLSVGQSSKECKRKVKRTVQREGVTSYATIDHSGTKAAQKAYLEHAQFREDNSRKKERKTSSPMVGAKERKSLTPVSMIRSRAGSMSSGSQ